MIQKFIHWIKGSFENVPEGASARKLASFTILLCIVIAHTSWIKSSFIKEDFSLLPEILIIDFGFIATCLGMTTYQAVQKSKLDSPEKKDTP